MTDVVLNTLIQLKGKQSDVEIVHRTSVSNRDDNLQRGRISSASRWPPKCLLPLILQSVYRLPSRRCWVSVSAAQAAAAALSHREQTSGQNGLEKAANGRCARVEREELGSVRGDECVSHVRICHTSTTSLKAGQPKNRSVYRLVIISVRYMYGR